MEEIIRKNRDGWQIMTISEDQLLRAIEQSVTGSYFYSKMSRAMVKTLWEQLEIEARNRPSLIEEEK